jgi:hypothetical protein
VVVPDRDPVEAGFVEMAPETSQFLKFDVLLSEVNAQLKVGHALFLSSGGVYQQGRLRSWQNPLKRPYRRPS